MNYHHLTIEERCCIREYYKKGKSYREIARLIGRNVGTISREPNRNFTHVYDIPTYYPHTAHKKYLFRRSFCHRGTFWNNEVIDYINDKLLLTLSPEQIANSPCELNLPSLGKSIRKRDKSGYKRKEFGHWEADTAVSGQGKTKYCFATSAEEIEQALNCNMYFADPYCAWQKGTNENLNGLLREFYPKGRNLERVSVGTLKKNPALINAGPKKVLNYQKPVDLFNYFLSYCCT